MNAEGVIKTLFEEFREGEAIAFDHGYGYGQFGKLRDSEGDTREICDKTVVRKPAAVGYYCDCGHTILFVRGSFEAMQNCDEDSFPPLVEIDAKPGGQTMEIPWFLAWQILEPEDKLYKRIEEILARFRELTESSGIQIVNE